MRIRGCGCGWESRVRAGGGLRCEVPWGTDRSCQADQRPVCNPALPPMFCGRQGFHPARGPVAGRLGPSSAWGGGGHSQNSVGVQAEAGGAVPSSRGPVASSRAGICSSQAPKHSLYFNSFWLLYHIGQLKQSHRILEAESPRSRHQQVQGLVRADPGLWIAAFCVLT